MAVKELLVSPEAEKWLATVKNEWEQIPDFGVDLEKFKHLAIICDGNRRAAQQRGLDPWMGHRVGVEVIKGIMEAGKKWGIKHLTFWVWSTENWKRDEDQVDFVMGLAARYLRDKEAIGKLFEHQVKFTHFGRKDRIPPQVRGTIEELEAKTANFDKRYVNLALDYGGVDEAARMVMRVTEAINRGLLKKDELLVNPGIVLGFLDNGGELVPDLVVRTGMPGEEIPRTSGFMPLQTTYSGWKFIPQLFPDLIPDVLLHHIKDFLSYQRRMGK